MVYNINMIKIISDIGFCFGVRHALDLMFRTKEEGYQVYLNHPLMHNEEENDKAMALSHARYFHAGDDKDLSGAIVFSAHGHPIEEEMVFGPFRQVDATCPLILARYKELSDRQAGVSYVFLGKRNHQETLGFLSHFPYFQFIDVDKNLEEQVNALSLHKEIAFIPQTTVSLDSYESCLKLLAARGEIVQKMTICPMYLARVRSAVGFLKDKDPMKSYVIVCGDKASSNANEILKAIQKAYPRIPVAIGMTEADFDRESLRGKDIYLTCATSCSEESVKALADSLSVL